MARAFPGLKAVFVIAAAQVWCGVGADAQQLPNRYTPTELVTLRVPGSTERLQPWRINDFGQITGQTTGAREAFLWTPDARNGTTGTIINLGDLAGGNSFRVAANSINNFGQIVGESRTASGQRAAFLWTPSSPNAGSGTMVAIATSATSDAAPVGRGINDYGQVIINRGGGNAALWTPDARNGQTGSLTNIVADPAPSAHVINNLGQVTGTVSTDTFNGFETYVWTPERPNAGSGTLARIGTHAGLMNSGPSGMNDLGQIAGYSISGDVTRGYVWTPGTPNAATGSFRDFGFNRPADVNNFGHVVGATNNARGFVATPAGNVFDLNTYLPAGSNWTIHGATDINNVGQILAYGTYDPPGPDAFPNDAWVLLTPVNIPEPSAALWAAGVAGIIAARRPARRR